jgi:hypothetical protein
MIVEIFILCVEHLFEPEQQQQIKGVCGAHIFHGNQMSMHYFADC